MSYAMYRIVTLPMTLSDPIAQITPILHFWSFISLQRLSPESSIFSERAVARPSVAYLSSVVCL